MMRAIVFVSCVLVVSPSFAGDELDQTVMIDEAICSYDQYDFPKILIRISPAIEIDGERISTFFAGGDRLNMCPQMETISSRLYIPVSFRTEETHFYQFDKRGRCNLHEGKILYMRIPVPTNTSRGVLGVHASVWSKIVDADVSPGNCSERY